MKKRNKKIRKPGAPQWAMQPFEDFIATTERLGQIMALSIRGISVLRAMPRIVEVVAKVENTSDEGTTKEKIERTRKEADLAQREVDEDFPVLHTQVLIALWSGLEASMRLFIARWLQNNKTAMEVDEIQKLKVRIGEYERLEGEDRFFYILDRLEQDLSAVLKCGVTRFETILQPFGLSGFVNENVRRDIFELNQVRNVLVHRNGIADRRLIDNCPWLDISVGNPLKISHAAIQKYFESVMNYVTELIVRVGEYYGAEMSKFRTSGRGKKIGGPPAVDKLTIGK